MVRAGSLYQQASVAVHRHYIQLEGRMALQSADYRTLGCPSQTNDRNPRARLTNGAGRPASLPHLVRTRFWDAFNTPRVGTVATIVIYDR